MNEKYIGSGGRFMIFAGVPNVGVAVLVCAHHFIERLVGQNIWPYFIVGMILILYVVSMFLSNYIPKRFLIPTGVLGWILMLSLLYWYFCFGPGAFGHSTF